MDATGESNPVERFAAALLSVCSVAMTPTGAYPSAASPSVGLPGPAEPEVVRTAGIAPALSRIRTG